MGGNGHIFPLSSMPRFVSPLTPTRLAHYKMHVGHQFVVEHRCIPLPQAGGMEIGVRGGGGCRGSKGDWGEGRGRCGAGVAVLGGGGGAGRLEHPSTAAASAASPPYAPCVAPFTLVFDPTQGREEWTHEEGVFIIKETP